MVGAMGTLGYAYFHSLVMFQVILFAFIGVTAFGFLIFVFLEYLKSRIFSGYPYLSKDKQIKARALKRVIWGNQIVKLLEMGLFIYLVVKSYDSLSRFEEWLTGTSVKGISLFLGIIGESFLTEVYPSYWNFETEYLQKLNVGGSAINVPLIIDNRNKFKTFFFASLGRKSKKIGAQNSQNDSDSSTSKSDKTLKKGTIADFSKIKLEKLGINHVSSALPLS